MTVLLLLAVASEPRCPVAVANKEDSGTHVKRDLKRDLNISHISPLLENNPVKSGLFWNQVYYKCIAITCAVRAEMLDGCC